MRRTLRPCRRPSKKAAKRSSRIPGRVLVDTNLVIAFFSGEKAVSQHFKETEVYVSSTVLGELYYGARKSAHAATNLAKIEQFATEVQVLSCDAVTSKLYGQIKDRLRSKGRPIPENDIWNCRHSDTARLVSGYSGRSFQRKWMDYASNIGED